MRPRQSARFAPSATPTVSRALSAIPQPVSSDSPQLKELRRQWKWAAVSQFLYTFASLVALEDVSLVQIEEDLTSSTMLVLPRLMQRLLTTLTHDRKISLNNWQTVLRKQYLKRSPEANPLGSEPRVPSPEPEPEPTVVRAVLEEPKTDRVAIGVEPSESTVVDQNKELGGDESGQISKAEDVQDEIKFGSDVKSESSFTPAPPQKMEDEDQKEPEQSKTWSDLTMLQQLDCIHTIVEWHFQNPTRLRTMMRSDDEYASWRIEPIGFNSKHDAYWLIGLDRLWIQHHPPKPPRKNLKRKAAPNASNRKSKAARTKSSIQDESPSSPTMAKKGKPAKASAPSPKAPPRATRGIPQRQSKTKENAKSNDAPASPGKSRAAKTQANAKLDQQAKVLAATRAELRSSGRAKALKEDQVSPSNGGRVLGTRVSRRLRGDVQDEWQPVPPEWMVDDDEDSVTGATTSTSHGRTTRRSKSKGRITASDDVEMAHEDVKTGLSSDDDSELTELSDSESNDQAGPKNAVSTDQLDTEEPQDAVEKEPESEPWPPVDFVEWETICVTLHEWESIAKQFEGATYHSEKALYRVLNDEVVPAVTNMLREIEKQRQKEEAVIHRKRSSRIAVKESEKEEARLTAQRQAEEEEKLARQRRMEARAKKEEEERLKRELAREQRRKEREEREEKIRSRGSRDKNSVDSHVDVVGHEDDPSAGTLPSSVSRSSSTRANRSLNGSHQHANGSSEDWELDCELCGSRGINRDDGLPIMSCGSCSKWQHILCHDKEDVRAGRPKRNWDVVDFTCRRCAAKRGGYNQSPYSQRGQQTAPLAMQAGSNSVPVHSSDLRLGAYGTRQNLEPRLAVNGQKTPASYAQTTGYYGGSTHAVPTPPTSASPYPSHPAVTFSHYQPQQRGFSPHIPSRHAAQPDHVQQSPVNGYRSSLPFHVSGGQGSGATWDRQGGSAAYSSHNQPYYNSSAHSAYSSMPHVGREPTSTHGNSMGGVQPYPNGAGYVNGLEANPVSDRSAAYRDTNATTPVYSHQVPYTSTSYTPYSQQHTTLYQQPHQQATAQLHRQTPQ